MMVQGSRKPLTCERRNGNKTDMIFVLRKKEKKINGRDAFVPNLTDHMPIPTKIALPSTIYHTHPSESE